MAASSYKVLARYEDSSLGLRAKCCDDIRRQARESLSKTRFRLRALKTLQNRKTLSRATIIDLPDSEDEYEPSHLSYDEVDNGHLFASNIGSNMNWGDSSTSWGDSSWANPSWSSPQRSDAPSPSISHMSEHSNWSYESSDDVAAEDFYEAILRETKNQTSTRRDQKSRRHLLKLRKRCQFLDPIKSRQDYENLRADIMRSQNQNTIKYIIYSKWRTFDTAIRTYDGELFSDCLQFLTNLVTQQVINGEEIVNLLQQGLVFALKDSISIHSGTPAVMRFFLAIMRTQPRAIPYIVQLMSNLHLLQDLDESLTYGTAEGTKLAFEFYEYLLATLLPQLNNLHQPQQAPIIPEIVQRTETTATIRQSYSPLSTLKLIVRTDLIVTIIRKYITQMNSCDQDEIPRAVDLLFKCLTFCYFQHMAPVKDVERTTNLLLHLLNEKIEPKLNKLIQNPVQLSKENLYCLKQFMSFYASFTATIMPTVDISKLNLDQLS